VLPLGALDGDLRNFPIRNANGGIKAAPFALSSPPAGNCVVCASAAAPRPAVNGGTPDGAPLAPLH